MCGPGISPWPCCCELLLGKSYEKISRYLSFLVVTTADHLAEIYGAELTFVVFIPHELPTILQQSQVDYVDQLRQLCTSTTFVRVVHSEAGSHVFPVARRPLRRQD